MWSKVKQRLTCVRSALLFLHWGKPVVYINILSLRLPFMQHLLCYKCPPKGPFGLLEPRVLITARNSISRFERAPRAKKRSGVFAQNDANTPDAHAHVWGSYLPQTSINAQLPSERRTQIPHRNIGNDIFGVWERISIRQMLQRTKLQRRLFDICQSLVGVTFAERFTQT